MHYLAHSCEGSSGGWCRREEFQEKSQLLDVLKLLLTKCQYKRIIYIIIYYMISNKIITYYYMNVNEGHILMNTSMETRARVL